MPDSTLTLSAIWESNAPFPTAQDILTPDGKIFHKFYSGKARFIGWIDFVLLKEIIKKRNITNIVITNLDELGKIANAIGRAKICTAYEYHHFIINKPFLKGKSVELRQCKPFYDESRIGGWEFSKDDEKIPSAALDYMRIILVRTRVNCITYATNKSVFTVHFDESENVVFEREAIV